MNILHAGKKLHMQDWFFESSMGYLLPALRFEDGLYDFCNFLSVLSLRATFTDSEMIEYCQKMCGWNIKSLKTKNYITNYARCTMLKK